jgi:probable F420-dependent oxidoreductase
VVASGIANIHARDPMAMANGAKALGEAYPGRFVLGIGVSHAPSVTVRGGTYGRPVETMRAYLDAMAAAQYGAPAPDPPVPLVLAALGPRMLELAAERADGAHPYFVPVEHTPFARHDLGSEPCLVVEQTAVLTTDPAEGRRTGRAFAKNYLAMWPIRQVAELNRLAKVAEFAPNLVVFATAVPRVFSPAEPGSP